jgi:hypothetical protein
MRVYARGNAKPKTNKFETPINIYYIGQDLVKFYLAKGNIDKE